VRWCALAQITTGEEGFFKKGTPYTDYDPFGTPSNVKPGWSGIIGQDFPTQHAGPNIDFGVMHFWPNNWATLGALCILSTHKCMY